jgi:putative pyoverdin transport system ATP-binding/permease protein
MIRDLRKILGRRRETRTRLAVAVAAGLLGGGSTSGLIALIHRSIETEAVPSLWVAAFFALWAGHGLFGVLSSLAVARMAQEIILDLRMELGRRLLGSSLEAVEEIGNARLLSMFTHVIDTISHSLERLPTLLTRVALLIGLYAYLAWLSIDLFLLFLSCILLGVAAYLLPLAAYHRYQRRMIQAHSHHLKQFGFLVGGIKELLQNRDKKRALLERYLHPSGEQFKKVTLRSAVLEAAVERWGEMYALLVLALMLFLLPAWGWASRTEVGEFLLLLLFSLGPMTTIIGFIFSLQQFKAAVQQLEEIGMELTPEKDAPESHLIAAAPPLSLRLENVAYTYHHVERDEPFCLGPLSLALEGPRILFITGGNGSGKSTLAKLLCGLYAPESGRIVVNDEPIDENSRDAYRQLFSTVFFDFFLFEALLGWEEQDLDAEANERLTRLRLARRVQVKEGKFSTIRLSQGQRKRLALMVALLDDRPVCLFDEWAADQDASFKEIFYREIIPGLKHQGKIAVVVTHDESYFDVADQVIRLVDGQQVNS